MKKIILSIATLLSTAAVFAFPNPTTWVIAPKHSVMFTAGGEVAGNFKTIQGTIVFDDKAPEASKFDLAIDVASVNTGNGLMNTHVKSADWLDAAKYPKIKFTTTKVTKSGAEYMATGTMELHGVKKEMTIPFKFLAKGNTAVFQSKFSVSRVDFKIGKAGGEVDDQIKLDLNVEVKK